MNLGQLFIVGFEGIELTSKLADKLQKINPAGVIFYDSNIESRDQVKKLISDLKNLLGEDLIISTDQEGGKVQRLRKITTSLPSLQALGRTSVIRGETQGLPFDEETIIDHSKLLASELAELGFNFVLAPCADLSTNPENPIIGTRSLGTDCKVVAKQIVTMIETYQSCSIKACVKHFPGHGDANKDSHFELPKVTRDKFNHIGHLTPFKAAIEAGVDAVMMAHVLYNIEDYQTMSKVLDQYPASMNAYHIQEVLRQDWSYKGLILADEITMKALEGYGSHSDIVSSMLQAGINAITWYTNLDEALDTCNSLDASLEPYYQESLEYITAFKKRLRVGNQLNLNGYNKKMFEIVNKAVEIQGTVGSEFFKDSKELALLFFDHPKLEEDVIKDVFSCDVFRFQEDGLDLSKLEPYNRLVILSFQCFNYPGQASFINRLRTQGKWQIIQCSCDMPDKEADINLFGSNRIHYQAAANFLS